MINFFGKNLNTYRASLHTHSTTSDGLFPVGEIVARYAAAGYDIICTTDHRKVNRMDSFDHKGALVICGVEMHPWDCRLQDLIHLLCIGVPQDFDVSVGREDRNDTNGPQRVIDAVNAAGGLCFLAHPYWCGYKYDDLLQLRGLAGIEVYNTSCRPVGKEYNMEIWDELCDSGMICNALAVDDIHTEREFFGGWTVVCCEECTEESVMAALRNGSYYATQGPEFTGIEFTDGKLSASFSPAVSVIAVANRYSGQCAALPPTVGNNTPISEATFDFTGFVHGCREAGVQGYIRLQIIDSNGRYAWTNPITVG